MTEYHEEYPSDRESFRLFSDLKREFNKNFDNRSAEKTADLFKKFLDEYQKQSAIHPKDKTLWAHNDALRIIAEETDIKFACTPDNFYDAENKRKLGVNSYFKNKYHATQKQILDNIMDAQNKKLYGKK